MESIGPELDSFGPVLVLDGEGEPDASVKQSENGHESFDLIDASEQLL